MINWQTSNRKLSEPLSFVFLLFFLSPVFYTLLGCLFCSFCGAVTWRLPVFLPQRNENVARKRGQALHLASTCVAL